MPQACSECNAPVPPSPGRRRFTCSTACSEARSRRHATRPVFVQPPCSECGGECPQRNGYTAFLTCSEECARRRRNRRARERSGWAEKACVDCGCDITGRRGKAVRCEGCALERRRELGRKRIAERRARRLADPEVATAEAKRRKNLMLRATYGMTHDDYDRMAESQGGVCASCGRPPMGRGKVNFLVVDHCHATGKVRGLLCGNCNSAIGLLDDDPEVIRKAADYLTRRRA